MFWWKDEVLYKPESIGMQTPTHDGWAVLLDELRELVRINDSLLDAGGLNCTALQPSLTYPPLHFFRANVQGLCQAVWSEPISSPLRAFSEAVQHGANGAGRSLHKPGNFLNWTHLYQVRKALLLGLCPGPALSLLGHAMLV